MATRGEEDGSVSGIDYAPPLDRLLTLGDVRGGREWADYAALGFGPEHIPELIRMATDERLNWADPDSQEVWAPIHAWRVLGLLRAEAAIEPLLGLFTELEDSDWIAEEMPEVFARIGPGAIAALAAFLADPAHDTWPRVHAASCLQAIAESHPETRAACVAALDRQLARYAETDPELNAFVLSNLIELGAVESAPLMQEAFAADQIDEFVAGDWEDAQVSLGLIPARATPRRRFAFGPPLSSDPADEVEPSDDEDEDEALDDGEEPLSIDSGRGVPGGAAQRTKAKAKAKGRAKMAKQSRKQNRKRK